jgi:GTP-binding protein YchF
MYLSIIGSPACGKTTLFKAFTGVAGSGSADSTSIAVVEVPDERLDRLSTMFKPKKTVYGRVEVCDMASLREGDMKNETVPAKQLQQMRSSDAFLLVLDGFQPHSPEPVSSFHTIVSEFILSDMVQIENRLERIKKQAGKKENTPLEQEKIMLERCLEHLEQGKPLSTLSLDDGYDRAVRGFQFLSIKPLMAVVNCSEDAMPRLAAITEETKGKLPDSTSVIAACLSIEADLAAMDQADRPAFMEEYGVEESLRGRLIRLAYQTLGLISFFTVGEDECRAWPIRKGMNAQEAAAVIHTDLSERFIRAETVGYEDFIRLGDFASCKKAGVWRLEGKQYVVQDGDIITVRAGA